MNKLCKIILNELNAKDDLKVGTTKNMTEKVLQFGEGNFLRAFIDYMIDELNSNDIFNGSIVVIQPIEQGLVDTLNNQDGLYTVVLRGIENGEKIVTKKVVTSISRGIDINKDFKQYLECIKNPELRFVVSNTTESGISYREGDKLTDTPPKSFPAKITALLYERYRIFNGDKTKGFIFIPCELIDNNGKVLKEIVLRYAKEWQLENEFIEWINSANYFTNTLVDKIVTGYPKDEINEFKEELGYIDNLIDTTEVFHFFAIEGDKKLSEEIPFGKIGLNVVWTDDATPYKLRKVRILNGAHTMSVFAGYLSGKDTVGEIMNDEIFIKYLKKGIFEEIIPTLDLPYEELESFANSVLERFLNPYIKHYLLSISLNSVSKYKTRVLPTILKYVEQKESLPEVLTFSFASLIAFYKGNKIKDNYLVGLRNTEEYHIIDDKEVLEFFKYVWEEETSTLDGILNVVKKICANVEFWGENLNEIPEFANEVSKILYNIMKNGIYQEIKNIIK